MKQRVMSILMAAILIVCLLPIAAFADGTVTLDAIPDKTPGSDVIISGTTTLTEVTVKVIRPNNTILYVNVLKGSSFRDLFTIPQDASDGTYTITAGQGSIKATQTFRVTKSPEIVSVTGIELKETRISLNVGSTMQLEAIVKPDNATNKNVMWSSSNTNVATVDSKGIVYAKAAGMANITATTEDGGKTADCEVIVIQKSSGGRSNKNKSSATSDTKKADTQQGTAPEISKKSFVDLGNFPWAKDQIEFLASKGIIKGTSDRTFNPEKNITRADFTLLLVRVLGLEAEYDSNFADVSKTDYYYEAIGIAKKLGIVKGAENNRFKPKDQITRQDLLAMVYRALIVTGKIKAGGDAETLKSFIDASELSDYAQEGVSTLIKNGIVQGIGGNRINPKGYATRAETAVIIYRIYNSLITQ